MLHCSLCLWTLLIHVRVGHYTKLRDGEQKFTQKKNVKKFYYLIKAIYQPTFSHIPYLVTIILAILVALSKSFDAPGER